MYFPRKDMQVLFLFSNKLSVFLLLANFLLWVESTYPVFLVYAEYFSFLCLLVAVILKKYVYFEKKHYSLPFCALYLVGTAPIASNALSCLSSELCFILGAVFCALSFVLEQESLYLFWLLSGLVQTGHLRHKSTANGMLIYSLVSSFLLRKIKHRNLNSAIAGRLFCASASIAAAKLFTNRTRFEIVFVIEFFFSFTVPLTVFILYQQKIKEQQKTRGRRRKIS